VDNKDLKELMEFISQSNFAEFEMERDGFKLKLTKEIAFAKEHAPMAVAALPAIQQALPPILPVAAAAAPAPLVAPAASANAAGADVYQVTAPMVGTFYRAPNPNSPPFVQVGDTVKKGQVICIIEAMKLMNEIESEVAGEVLESPVSNGQPVEYGEVLFRLRLTGS
jgi:acetyl-CoA carboxylase biotin carboxyl carrier protein